MAINLPGKSRVSRKAGVSTGGHVLRKMAGAAGVVPGGCVSEM
jgi:hypothetical protein